jgi:flotillin
MIIRKLPEIAGAIAKPLEKTDRILVVSGADDNSLASNLTNAFAKIPPTVETISGIDINKAIQNFVKQTPAAKA